MLYTVSSARLTSYESVSISSGVSRVGQRHGGHVQITACIWGALALWKRNFCSAESVSDEKE